MACTHSPWCASHMKSLPDILVAGPRCQPSSVWVPGDSPDRPFVRGKSPYPDAGGVIGQAGDQILE